jgi:beta-barrel assembly-enhancing protease
VGSRHSIRDVSAIAALALLAVACSAGDLARNTARNAFGSGSERGADLAGALVQSGADLRDQMGIQFSPEQEYFLGRGVAAAGIAKYGLDPDEARQAYVRKIGAALVDLAPRVRTTYGGYHFAVLNSDEANGFSGPGGFVMVTRGAVARAKSEDELAGVLAHEIAHVSLKHGENVIRESGQWREGFAAGMRIFTAAAGAGARQSSHLTGLFRDTVRGFAADLASKGYGAAAEHAADLEGAAILYDAGYDAGALTSYLAATAGRPQPAWTAHPSSDERTAALASFVATYGGPFDGGIGLAARTARFSRTLAKH